MDVHDLAFGGHGPRLKAADTGDGTSHVGAVFRFDVGLRPAPCGVWVLLPLAETGVRNP